MAHWRGRPWLAAEFILIFFVLVGLFALVKVPGGPIPALLLLTVAVAVYFRRRTSFDRRDLWRPSALRPALPSILRLWTIAAVAAVYLFDRTHLFDLPRHNPGLWALIVIAYPVVSVYRYLSVSKRDS